MAGVPIPASVGRLLEDLAVLPRVDLLLVFIVGVTAGLILALAIVFACAYVLFG